MSIIGSHRGTADHPPGAEASPMQELIEIDSSAAHSCANPRVERWHVYEQEAEVDHHT